jgi:hypothetical protein
MACFMETGATGENFEHVDFCFKSIVKVQWILELRHVVLAELRILKLWIVEGFLECEANIVSEKRVV